MNDSREANNDWGLDPRRPKEISTGEVRDVMRDLEEALCARSSGVNNTFWNAFPVELGKLFDEMVVLEKNRPFSQETTKFNVVYAELGLPQKNTEQYRDA